MYYLVVRNLDDARCIDRNDNDVYEDGMSLNCTPDLDFSMNEFVKEVIIRCAENPQEPVMARVYRD